MISEPEATRARPSSGRARSRPGLARRLGRRRDLRWYFDHHDGRLIDKWLHYFPIYERHLAPFRDRGPRLLEIGISHGGSLQMWRDYLGPDATIVGIDIEPRVASLTEPGIEIHVGSQSDPEFLAGLVSRHGGFDVVIDDGSHWFADQAASLDVLWPALSVGGIYVVEDVHTSYLASYEGGVDVPDTLIGWLRDRIDDVHGHWIEGQAPLESQSSDDGAAAVDRWTSSLGGIHVYDSIVVLDKSHRERPVRRMSGQPAFDTLYDHPVEALLDGHRHEPEPSARARVVAALRSARAKVAAVVGRAVRRSTAE